MKNILVVFNKKSGKKKFFSYRKIIFNRLKEFDINFKFIYIDMLDKIQNIEKYDTIIAVGGDGTVLSILPYIVNTEKKLGIIPCGTANLFASSLSIPFNINKALGIILFKKTLKVDLGKAAGKYFSLRVGIGYDADIINSSKSNLKSKIGYMAYFIQGIINIFKLSQKTYKLKIDGKELVINANSLIVANAGNMFRKFCTIAPNGAINDGKLDIFILKVKNFFDFLEVFFRILFGFHKNNSKVFYAQAATISIQTEENNWHVDGERFLTQNELNIQILPKAIDVIVP
ncbi:MAG: YegS/Rv2252/BmrU family lipid kinase [Candidatus Aenigmarchaeota archaeon]|nr:YegS/Rv2252/BmrU family lipid kinase [Candidatus Aenigmarchaeota archaeon]